MKKRRTLIISLLLVAALALGVGYAALSSTLQINGVIENDPANVNVVFTGSTMNATSPTSARVQSIMDASDKGSVGTAVLSIQAGGLKEVGDTVTFDLEITNKGNLTVEVAELVPTEEFECDFYSLEVDSWDANIHLEPNDIATATVTVKVIKLTDTQEIHNFILQAVATPLND